MVYGRPTGVEEFFEPVGCKAFKCRKCGKTVSRTGQYRHRTTCPVMDLPLSHAITGGGDPSGVGSFGDVGGHQQGTAIEDTPGDDCETEQSPTMADVSMTPSPTRVCSEDDAQDGVDPCPPQLLYLSGDDEYSAGEDASSLDAGDWHACVAVNVAHCRVGKQALAPIEGLCSWTYLCMGCSSL